MNSHRFLNPSQPQTLVNATLLCYFQAFFAFIDGGGFAVLLLLALGLGAGGFGIANDKKWGYTVAVVASVLNVGLWLALLGLNVLGFPAIISFAFSVVLVVLLTHPMSRDYQRIWFE